METFPLDLCSSITKAGVPSSGIREGTVFKEG